MFPDLPLPNSQTCFPCLARPSHPLDPSSRFITVFVTVFATVIAITKDLPDVEGDQAHNIQTFATRLGVPTVSNLGRWRAASPGLQCVSAVRWCHAALLRTAAACSCLVGKRAVRSFFEAATDQVFNEQPTDLACRTQIGKVAAKNTAKPSTKHTARRTAQHGASSSYSLTARCTIIIPTDSPLALALLCLSSKPQASACCS